MNHEQICIIMADGKAKRMSGLNKKKQLVEIDGEKIIDRTIRQLRNLGIEPVIATHFEDFDYLNIQHIVPEGNDYEITKFNANKKYYQDYNETLFIWGDTYFEDIDIETIVNTPVDKFKFFGSEFEIFGFKIKKPYYPLIDAGTEYIISRIKTDTLDYGNTGTWGLLRHMGGYPLIPDPKYRPGMGVTSIHEPQKYITQGLLYIVPGESMDLDGHKDVIRFAERFPNKKIEELEFTEAGGEVYKFINGKWVLK